MKRYIAAKPCSFGGRRYEIGEAIEAGAVDPNRASKLIGFGVIRADDGTEEPQTATPAPAETIDAAPATAKAKKQTRRKKVE